MHSMAMPEFMFYILRQFSNKDMLSFRGCTQRLEGFEMQPPFKIDRSNRPNLVCLSVRLSMHHSVDVSLCRMAVC